MTRSQLLLANCQGPAQALQSLGNALLPLIGDREVVQQQCDLLAVSPRRGLPERDGPAIGLFGVRVTQRIGLSLPQIRKRRGDVAMVLAHMLLENRNAFFQDSDRSLRGAHTCESDAKFVKGSTH